MHIRTANVLALVGSLALAGEQVRPPGPEVQPRERHRVIEAIARLKMPSSAARQRALRTIERFAEKAIRPLVLAARHDDPVLRARVAHALGRVGKGDRDALFALTTLLRDPEAPVRREAITALGQTGDRSHIAELEKRLDDRVQAVRGDAVHAIAELAGDDAPQHLAELLKHEGPAVRRAALAELLERKPSRLSPLLPSLLKDPDPGVRADAADALARTKKEKAVPPLLALLDDQSPRVRAAAVMALKDAKAKEAVPRLMDLVKDPDESVRLEAISALGLLDHQRVAVEPLMKLLTGPSKRVRERAAFALGLLGRQRGTGDRYAPRARKAVPALIQRLDDDAPDVRHKAHLALRLILDGTVPFDPHGSAERRQKAMAQWQRLWRKTRQ